MTTPKKQSRVPTVGSRHYSMNTGHGSVPVIVIRNVYHNGDTKEPGTWHWPEYVAPVEEKKESNV